MAGLELWLVQFSAWALAFVQAYGYFGVFVINLISSATIFFPLPAFALTFGLGAVLNPWLLGLSAGLGSAIGELTGYLLGYGSQEALKKRYKKWVKKSQDMAKKRGMFFAIFFITVTPIPSDIAGILAGISKYDVRKFFLAVLAANMIKYTLIAWAGFYGLSWIAGMFGIG